MSSLQGASFLASAIVTAIGVIGAVSIFIFEKISEKKQATMLRCLESTNQKVIELEAELKALKIQQCEQRNRRRRTTQHTEVYSNGSTYVTSDDTDVDVFSTVGTDFDDDEFFDLSDDEGTGDNDKRRSEAISAVDSMLAAVDKQIEAEARQEHVHNMLQTLANSHPNNVEVTWRLARACYNCSNSTADPIVKEEFILKGLRACEQVTEPWNANMHKWYAILVGSHGDFLSLKEKIENGYRFKEHVIKALEQASDDCTLHYLLGRFKYEVSSLSWIERKIASTLFAKPPSATYEDAITDFEQAEMLATKPYIENRLFLAKAYLALNQYEHAVQWLNKVCELPALTEEDRRVQIEAEQLLSRYSKYS